MPIDKDSVLNMSRLLLEFPGKEPATLIQMTRLELPVTETNIEQFEQYRNASHQILGSAETIMEELPRAFAELLAEGRGEQALALYEAVIEIFTEGKPEGDGTVILQEAGADASQAETAAGENVSTQTQDAQNAQNVQTADAGSAAVTENQTAGEDTGNLAVSGKTVPTLLPEDTVVGEKTAEQAGKEAPPEAAEAGTDRPPLLSQGQWEKLGDALRRMGADEQTAAQVKGGQFSPKEVLQLVRHLMTGIREKQVPEQEQALQRLLGGKEFQTLLKEQIGRQWTIEPKDVADKKQVEQLYERIREQTARLSQALETAGKGEAPVARSVHNLQSNVDFMNQMNHLYTYVQLPLKMMGNNAHGDLYVYTNRKNLAAKDGQVSALLHLDMEHLGPLDVYVTMKEKQVSTNFTVMDDSILDLIEGNIGLLNQRLESRGYSLKAQMHVKEETGEEEDGSIMHTILSQQKNISVLSRTSFDMRA